MTPTAVDKLKAKIDAELQSASAEAGIAFGSVAYEEFRVRGWFEERTERADGTSFEYPVTTYQGRVVVDDISFAQDQAELRP